MYPVGGEGLPLMHNITNFLRFGGEKGASTSHHRERDSVECLEATRGDSHSLIENKF